VANLSEDADTTDEVCGQLAGANYGLNSIPNSWFTKLAKRKLIESLANKLFDLRIPS